MTRDAFAQLVRDALGGLYDPVHLQAHPLAGELLLQRGIGETAAEALRRYLREGIDALKPPASTPPDRPEWLGYRVLHLHYVRCLLPAEICQELNISEATFYRRQREGLHALTSVLWDRHRPPEGHAEESRHDAPDALSGASPSASPRDAHKDSLDRAVALASQVPHVVDLAQVVESVRQTIAPLLAQRGATLSLDVPPSLPAAYGNSAVLRQVVLGVLTSCLRTTRGEVIHLQVTPTDGETLWALCVEGGTGQALEAVTECDAFTVGQDLLGSLGGRMWVEGDAIATQRLCFTVPTMTPRTILVIDDDPATTRLYERYLAPAHYAVWHAHTVEQAEEMLSRRLPDLILLDVLLPRQDGWIILKALKSQARTAHIPVVVCSVIAQPELALALGAAEVLTKPISPEALLAAVHRWQAEAGTTA